jgi:hypothetical protein
LRETRNQFPITLNSNRSFRAKTPSSAKTPKA